MKKKFRNIQKQHSQHLKTTLATLRSTFAIMQHQHETLATSPQTPNIHLQHLGHGDCEGLLLNDTLLLLAAATEASSSIAAWCSAEVEECALTTEQHQASFARREPARSAVLPLEERPPAPSRLYRGRCKLYAAATHMSYAWSHHCRRRGHSRLTASTLTAGKRCTKAVATALLVWLDPKP